MQMTIPAHFAGPIPHAHDAFDEAIYVLRGRLLVAGDDEPQEAAAGSMFVAPRGQRHAFSNPHGTVAWVLGIWALAGRPARQTGSNCSTCKRCRLPGTATGAARSPVPGSPTTPDGRNRGEPGTRRRVRRVRRAAWGNGPGAIRVPRPRLTQPSRRSARVPVSDGGHCRAVPNGTICARPGPGANVRLCLICGCWD